MLIVATKTIHKGKHWVFSGGIDYHVYIRQKIYEQEVLASDQRTD